MRPHPIVVGRCLRWPLAAFVALTVVCRPYIAPSLAPSAFPFRVDSLRTEIVRAGVVHRFIYAGVGPWAIHTLEVDRTRCWSARAVKAAGGALGVDKTSALVGQLTARRTKVAGGVNADGLVATGSGLPAGVHMSGSRVIVGPANDVVLAFDESGAPSITRLHTSGQATVGRASYAISGWNRPIATGLAFIDAAWGPKTDTASGVVELQMRRISHSAYHVVRADTATAGVTLAADGAVLVAGRNAAASLRRDLLAARAGDTIRLVVAVTPLHPGEAVGGRALLLRDSVALAELETTGEPGRQARTAVGITSKGRRLILVVVDGQQKPYSDGMTLRELATLMRALGARDAISLEGGASSTFVAADPAMGRRLRVMNQPSDAEGERRVPNALGIVNRC